jgi:uncharacterized protein YaaR (DUF327 family)
MGNLRIDKSKSVGDVTQGPQGVTHRRAPAEGAAAFGQVLRDEQGRADSHAVLQKLLDQITEQGEMIARRKDINDIKKYRQLVSDFLDEAMRSAYRTDREGSFDSRGRYKEYSIVKKINDEVEKLASRALSDQRDNLEILGQLGTIRGLLIDLMI